MNITKKILIVLLSVVILIGSLPVISFAEASEEDSQIVYFNGHKYQAFDTWMTWHQAKAYCESRGGHLATITSAQEQAALKKFEDSYWLGGTDSGSEGSWRWITGETWGYTNWDDEEPNNLGDEHYLIKLGDHRWNDLCEDSYEQSGFICEWDDYSSSDKWTEEENSNDSPSDWLLYDSYYDQTKGYFVLTEDHTSWETGAIWYNQPCEGDFTLEMDYYTGSSNRALDGADGIVVAFYAKKDYTMSGGEELGFSGCNGYGVELDTYENSNQGDPGYNHIGLIKDHVGNHLVTANLSTESEDEQWHHLKVVVENNTCFAYVDGKLKFSQAIQKTGYGQIGITSATGNGHNLHAVKNVSVTNHEQIFDSSATEKFFNIQLSHVKNESYNSNEYMEYRVTAEITNTADFIAENTEVSINLPKEMMLPDESDMSVGNIRSNETKTVSWTVYVPVKFENKSSSYSVTVTINNNIQLTQEKKIFFGKGVYFYHPDIEQPLLATYSDSYFSETAYTYNHDLAYLSLCLEVASFTADTTTWGEGAKYDSKNVKPNTSQLARSRYKNIETAYKDLGFEKAYFYNYEITLNDTSDKVAFSIATKKDVNGATLIAVVIRGGGYGAEWSSNFNVGSGELYHEAFYTAAKEVYSKVIENPDYGTIDGNIKFWITGYSRGAAVANILSAMLDDASNGSNQFAADDIYAYTFATPQGVTYGMNPKRKLYMNIHNIVNPGDVVPEVAPSKWDFTRYGKTYYFSPFTYTNEIFNAGAFSSINDNYYKMTGEKFNAQANLNGETTVKALINIVNNTFPSVDQAETMLEVIQEFLEFCNTKQLSKNETYESIKITDYKIDYLLERYKEQFVRADFYVDIYINNLGLDLSSQYRDYLSLLLVLGEIHGIPYDEMLAFVLSIINIENVFESLIIMATPKQTIQNFASIGEIGRAHNSQVYLAWMMQNEYQALGIVNSLFTKVMSIACPVNVTVRDKSGKVVASIVNHKIITAEIPVIVDGEMTQIYFSSFSDEDYTVEIVATDNGTMNYTVTELNVAGEPVKRANYYDVQLKNNQTFTANVLALTDFTDDKYDLRTSNGGTEVIISASEILSSTEENVTVNVIASGGGTVVGSGNYIRGESVNLKAYAAKGYVFAGWYVKNQFVSDEDTYLIRVLEDTEIKAVFNVCEHTWNAGEITKQPTNTECGEKTYVCTECGAIQTEEIPKLSVESDSTEPTTDEDDIDEDEHSLFTFDFISKELIVIVGVSVVGVILLAIICCIVIKIKKSNRI